MNEHHFNEHQSKVLGTESQPLELKSKVTKWDLNMCISYKEFLSSGPKSFAPQTATWSLVFSFSFIFSADHQQDIGFSSNPFSEALKVSR
ncbi:hypothetical protein LWI29_013654 [Acer saccharum]|uniref:Uncharacterized protein n=1 Tax=Acer saccharum TaxID=4024 RepID=A0AA39TPD4_ACESA|nr:hypothetical protein LWI29_013654 [Acer saccharum]